MQKKFYKQRRILRVWPLMLVSGLLICLYTLIALQLLPGYVQVTGAFVYTDFVIKGLVLAVTLIYIFYANSWVGWELKPVSVIRIRSRRLLLYLIIRRLLLVSILPTLLVITSRYMLFGTMTTGEFVVGIFQVGAFVFTISGISVASMIRNHGFELSVMMVFSFFSASYLMQISGSIISRYVAGFLALFPEYIGNTESCLSSGVILSFCLIMLVTRLLKLEV